MLGNVIFPPHTHADPLRQLAMECLEHRAAQLDAQLLAISREQGLLAACQDVRTLADSIGLKVWNSRFFLYTGSRIKTHCHQHRSYHSNPYRNTMRSSNRTTDLQKRSFGSNVFTLSVQIGFRSVSRTTRRKGPTTDRRKTVLHRYQPACSPLQKTNLTSQMRTLSKTCSFCLMKQPS